MHLKASLPASPRNSRNGKNCVVIRSTYMGTVKGLQSITARLVTARRRGVTIKFCKVSKSRRRYKVQVPVLTITSFNLYVCVYASRLLSKNLKIKIYKTIVLPVVLYDCETWSLILREESRLRVFENRILRQIFGPKRHLNEKKLEKEYTTQFIKIIETIMNQSYFQFNNRQIQIL